MEGILLGIAYAAFALAICSAIASVVIFIKFDVPDAVRFLRHKPMKNKGKGAAKKRAKDATQSHPSKKPSKISKRLTRSTEEVVEKAHVLVSEISDEASSEKDMTGTTVIDAVSHTASLETSNTATDLLVDVEGAERPTSLLEEEESERPTGLLQEEETERPTSVLQEEETERATSILKDTERSTGLLSDEASEGVAERPTSVLEDAKAPTESLCSTFKFVIKRKALSVNTDEEI